jgi:hypothetical protein
MAQVLFFPNLYRPDPWKMRELWDLQGQLELWLIELKYNQKPMSIGEKAQAKQAYHKSFRDTWKVLEWNEVDELSKAN